MPLIHGMDRETWKAMTHVINLAQSNQRDKAIGAVKALIDDLVAFQDPGQIDHVLVYVATNLSIFSRNVAVVAAFLKQTAPLHSILTKRLMLETSTKGCSKQIGMTHPRIFS